MARLDLYVNYEKKASIKLDLPEVVLGRDSHCDVQIPDPRVSRRHAVVRGESGTHVIENFGANGTRVNGDVIDTPRPLAAGDAIFIGSYILVYQPDEACEEDPGETLLL